MKIIFSPTKERNLNKDTVYNSYTKEIHNLIAQNQHIFFEDKYLKVKNTLTEKEKEGIESLYKLSQKKAEEHKFNCLNHDKICALGSYNGLSFRQLKREEFLLSHYKYILEHLRIMSSLYGIHNPLKEIEYYRLDQNISLGLNLNKLWKEVLFNIYQDEDYVINLASKEYSKLLSNHNMINIIFLQEKNNILKEVSTESKKGRGILLNFMIQNQIKDLPGIKSFNDSYEFYKEEGNNLFFKRIFY